MGVSVVGEDIELSQLVPGWSAGVEIELLHTKISSKTGTVQLE